MNLTTEQLQQHPMVKELLDLMTEKSRRLNEIREEDTRLQGEITALSHTIGMIILKIDEPGSPSPSRPPVPEVCEYQ